MLGKIVRVFATGTWEVFGVTGTRRVFDTRRTRGVFNNLVSQVLGEYLAM